MMDPPVDEYQSTDPANVKQQESSNYICAQSKTKVFVKKIFFLTLTLCLAEIFWKFAL